MEARFAIPRSGAPCAAGGQEPELLAIGDLRYMVNSRWAWPAAETVHFLGLSLSFGVLLAVNLRILGVMRQVAFADVHRLLPWGMLGFGVNLITGMLFVVGQPGQYIESAPFHWKVVFLMIAGANFLYLTVFKKGVDAGRRPDSSLGRQGHGGRVPRLVARRAVRGPDAAVPRQRLLREGKRATVYVYGLQSVHDTNMAGGLGRPETRGGVLVLWEPARSAVLCRKRG